MITIASPAVRAMLALRRLAHAAVRVDGHGARAPRTPRLEAAIDDALRSGVSALKVAAATQIGQGAIKRRLWSLGLMPAPAGRPASARCVLLARGVRSRHTYTAEQALLLADALVRGGAEEVIIADARG